MTKSIRETLALLAFLAACFLVSGLGALATFSSVDTWYVTLSKPPFNPPDWIFGPVWTALYVMMAIAAWRVWRKPRTPARNLGLLLFGIQLLLNLLWSVLFFGLRQTGFALAEIVLLLIIIAATGIKFYRVDPAAGLMFVPYLLWVAFATVLNASIWLLN